MGLRSIVTNLSEVSRLSLERVESFTTVAASMMTRHSSLEFLLHMLELGRESHEGKAAFSTMELGIVFEPKVRGDVPRLVEIALLQHGSLDKRWKNMK